MARLMPVRRLLIIMVYVVVFWVALPLALFAIGHWLDALFGLTPSPSPWGWPPPVT